MNFGPKVYTSQLCCHTYRVEHISIRRSEAECHSEDRNTHLSSYLRSVQVSHKPDLQVVIANTPTLSQIAETFFHVSNCIERAPLRRHNDELAYQLMVRPLYLLNRGSLTRSFEDLKCLRAERLSHFDETLT